MLILAVYKYQYWFIYLKLTVVHFMDLKCGKLIVNPLTVFVHLRKGVRRILDLPHDANTWLLGPLLKQNHTKKQFIVSTLRFLLFMLKSHNGIVEVCTLNLCLMLIPLWDPVCPFCVLNIESIFNHI